MIPSFSARGTVCDMALRRISDDDADASPKYLFLPGVPKRLYGMEDLPTAGPEIHIAEGHPDRMTLKACGLPSIGVAGVNAWKGYHRRILAGFERVYFWAQSDDKGQSEGLGERIRAALPAVTVIVVVPQGHDLNSYYVANGKQAVLDLIPTDGDDPRDDVSQEGETDEWIDEDLPPF